MEDAWLVISPPRVKIRPSVRPVTRAARVVPDHSGCSRWNPCRQWFCKRCESAKTSREAKSLARDRIWGREIVHITLTRQHWEGECLRKQRADLFECFRRLRQTKSWDQVLGGKAYLHVVGSHGNGCHLHIVAEVVDGYDLDQLRDDVSRTWTWRSNVDRLPQNWKAQQKLSFYVTKGLVRQYDSHPEEGRREALYAAHRDLKGCRKMQAFGSWLRKAEVNRQATETTETTAAGAGDELCLLDYSSETVEIARSENVEIGHAQTAFDNYPKAAAQLHKPVETSVSESLQFQNYNLGHIPAYLARIPHLSEQEIQHEINLILDLPDLTNSGRYNS